MRTLFDRVWDAHVVRELADGVSLLYVDLHLVHVIGPELGATQPGMVVVCGDSHTSTHGAFGAFALGIGTSEVEHVLATQCIVMKKPRNMEDRMTVCNMSIEAGARAGMIAPDEVTFAYLGGRPRAPGGAAWANAVERW